MARSHRIIQDTPPKTLLSLEKPSILSRDPIGRCEASGYRVAGEEHALKGRDCSNRVDRPRLSAYQRLLSRLLEADSLSTQIYLGQEFFLHYSAAVGNICESNSPVGG